MTKSFKNSYADQWAKAARNCQQVHQDLRRWFPDLCFPLGHGAISDKWENGDHDSGEVDIFVTFAGHTIAGIEVTGSSKVNYPCEVWIGEHKIKYADAQDFEVAYVLFYNNAVRVCTAQMIRKVAPDPQPRRIFGNLEHYHILDPRFTARFSDLKTWLEVERFKQLRKLGYAGTSKKQ